MKRQTSQWHQLSGCLQNVLSSWIVFLLFSLGACIPVKQGNEIQSFHFSSGQSGTGSLSGYRTAGSGSDMNLSDQQLASIAHFVAEILRFMPNRPFPRDAWTSDQVPLGTVEQRPLYPSSHVVKTSSGYQRARDFTSDAKYTQDIFDHINVDGGKQEGSSETGSKGQKGY
uniref:Uncharacterized protein n=1 Tax=Oryzias sinensis TaxID=183150 RepID=A0A8C7YX94_9TELE